MKSWIKQRAQEKLLRHSCPLFVVPRDPLGFVHIGAPLQQAQQTNQTHNRMMSVWHTTRASGKRHSAGKSKRQCRDVCALLVPSTFGTRQASEIRCSAAEKRPIVFEAKREGGSASPHSTILSLMARRVCRRQSVKKNKSEITASFFSSLVL